MLTISLPMAGGAMPRHHIEKYIETLIDMLDALDGDCDLEEGGDLEPYLTGADPGDADREHDPLEHHEGNDTEDLEPDTDEDWRQPLHLLDMADAA